MAAAAAAVFFPSTPSPRYRLAAAARRSPPSFTGATDAVPPPEDEDSSDDDADDDAAPRRSGRRDRRRAVRVAWEKLVRWSRSWRRRNRSDVLETTRKVDSLAPSICGLGLGLGRLASSFAGSDREGLSGESLLFQVVVLGGGSFGTAMAAHVAAKKADLEVAMLLRDDLVCRSINNAHVNWLVTSAAFLFSIHVVE
jgi:glycerol-3-phosphate dehydrogenase (NAD+)